MRSYFTSLCVFLAVAAAGCAQSRSSGPEPRSGGATAASDAPRGGSAGRARAGAASSGGLIPRAIVFGNPDKGAPAISPDGKQLAFLAPHEGVMNIWVGPAVNPGQAQPVTNDRQRGIRTFRWAYNNTHILYLQDKGGDENWRLHAVDLAAGRDRDLTPIDGIQARIEHLSPNFPDEVLLAINDRQREVHDLHRLNIVTGERRTVMLNNENFVGFTVDDDFRVRLASRVTPDGGLAIVQSTGTGEWKPLADVPMEDSLSTAPLGMSKDGASAYLTDSRGRDTAAVVALQLATGESRVLAADDRADISDVLMHPTEKAIQAVSVNYDRAKWVILDESIRADFEYLRKVSEGDFDVLSRTLDDKVWIVQFERDDGPVRYYHYDRTAGHAQFLFENRSGLHGRALARMHPRVIPARDGLNLVSYLSLPPASDPDHDGAPARPLPMVLLVHGGPWGRDQWGYNSLHQWLANRGYAVLSVNFRGSTGFGKRFINAGNREWAGRMHDDLLDAVQWATRAGVADPARIAIMGGSYGGYATLVGMTFTPDVFACGVDIVGPSNLITLLSTIPPYWKPMMDMFTTRVGDPRTEEGQALLAERSPLTYVDRIRRPLLIGQGANDPRVKQAEADQIVNAMKAGNVPVTYVLYPDEGHGFARPENRLSFYAVTEAFLAAHLGGEFEPIGDDFRGSSITVPTGSEHVPGVEGALKTMHQ